MDMSFEDLIRERAYHIWLAGGMADGHEHEHWAMAEQAMKADVEPVVILTTKPAKRAAKAATTKAVTAKKTSARAKPAAKIAKPAAKKAKAEVAASL